MVIDIEAMLRRVVEEELDARFAVTITSDDRSWHRARISADETGRSCVIAADAEWFQLGVPALDVGTFLLDHDEDPAYKQAILRGLVRVARAYVQGQGRVEWRRGLLRHRPVVLIEVEGEQWELGHRTGRGHYPTRER